ncbi:hypothetical protein FOZ63_022485, partial [Perkinsus olseni]
TILIWSLVYFAGLCLLVAATLEPISEPWMVHTSLLFLISFGAGGIKSCVNVMGAQQYHPKYYQTQKFFNFFYACISIGALIGGVTTPPLLQAYGFTASFSFPLILFAIGTAVFICGGVTDRFVKREPQGSAVLQAVM